MHTSDGDQRRKLPNTGTALQEMVQVVLMTQGEQMDPEIVSQATIRREVVILLINEMIKRGHREYKDYQIKDVRSHAKAYLVPHAKADMTPTVPKEVLVTLTKKLNLNKR